MKKITWGLLALLIGQPIIVYIGQAALLTTGSVAKFENQTRPL